MCLCPSGNLLSAATVESGPKQRHQNGCVLLGRGVGGGQKPHSCFPKWARDEEQGEVRGSPSQEGRPGARLVGITQRSQHTHQFFIASSTNISPTGRAEGSGQFYDVNRRLFTLLRTCLLLKTSLKWRHSSSVYLDISKRTFFGAFVP